MGPDRPTLKQAPERPHRYARCHRNSAARSVGRNRLHPVEERLARWLLMTHDRVDGDRLPG